MNEAPAGTVNESDEQELDRRIERKLRQLGLLVPDAWMTPSEAAGHARVSRWHLLRLCRAGCGPESCGVGKMMRFRRSAIDRWLDDRLGHAT
ncbi:MAG: helix-turn-helix domain-containing protein [Xanthobacteraceae bacterium]|nr:helix-turn-helix domain-containing protein [Xanthobacteraceae bacterium]